MFNSGNSPGQSFRLSVITCCVVINMSFDDIYSSENRAIIQLEHSIRFECVSLSLPVNP